MLTAPKQPRLRAEIIQSRMAEGSCLKPVPLSVADLDSEINGNLKKIALIHQCNAQLQAKRDQLAWQSTL